MERQEVRNLAKDTSIEKKKVYRERERSYNEFYELVFVEKKYRTFVFPQNSHHFKKKPVHFHDSFPSYNRLYYPSHDEPLFLIDR